MRAYLAGHAQLLGEAALAGHPAAYFSARFAPSLPLLRLAFRDETLCGFMLMVTPRQIELFYVDPRSQGLGTGRALLADAEARGAHSIEFFRANFTGRRFFERHGWRLVSTFPRLIAGTRHDFVRYEKAT